MYPRIAHISSMAWGPASCWRQWVQRNAGYRGECTSGNKKIDSRTWVQRHAGSRGRVISANFILPKRRWVQRHAGAPWGGSIVLHPMPLITLSYSRQFSSHGISFFAYLASGRRGGNVTLHPTAANISFLFPLVPHPRELLLCDAEAEKGSSISQNLPRERNFR